MGFPGALGTRATYRILPGPALALEITATTDAATICNFAHHSYFNLDGTPSAIDHLLRIDATDYLEADADLVPTGTLHPVEGTAFDFRKARPLRRGDVRYDLNYCLSQTRRPLCEVAALTGPQSGLTLTVETTEPGLLLYDGTQTATASAPGLAGLPYGPFAGVALEPQCWPDAPNQRWAHQVQLAAGETYRQLSVFRFGADG